MRGYQIMHNPLISTPHRRQNEPGEYELGGLLASFHPSRGRVGPVLGARYQDSEA